MFFDRYVTGHSRTYDYISSLISTADAESCLSNAIGAASLAYFSTQTSTKKILKDAREKYVLALRLVSEAVESRDIAVKDSTLVSVLLLDLFEKLTRTCRSSESWTKHMSGAIELVKLRGDSQFRNQLGLRLFLQLSSTILIGCVQHDVRVPVDLINLRREASKYVDPIDPKWKFSDIVVQFVEFRARLLEDQVHGQEFLATAKRIDTDLRMVSENVPTEWKYDTVMAQPPCKEVYGDHFDVYADHHMTHTWNNIRIIRILLNELIKEHLVERDSTETASASPVVFGDDYFHASECIISLSTGILASVPQYTQLPRHKNCLFSTKPSQDVSGQSQSAAKPTSLAEFKLPNIPSSGPVRFEPRDFTAFETSRCYTLIFPLYVAGSSEICPQPMREWILNTLDTIENIVGIKEAAVAAGYLKRREKINPWSLYAMIGSYSFSA
jgi:hypothetical protein